MRAHPQSPDRPDAHRVPGGAGGADGEPVAETGTAHALERGGIARRSMTIRPMTHADIADGLRLCRASNWNQLEDDWRVFLDRGGGLLAVEGGEIVGSVAWLPFGGEFTWLSMMLVDPTARRGG